MNDLKFAFRQLLKNPDFTAVVVLTFALGIGVTTSAFSALNAVLLRSLPYKRPEELVWIFASNPKIGYPRLPVNWASGLYSEWLRENQAFAEVGKFKAKGFLLMESERSESVNGMRASVNIFDVLGIQPMLGRTFRPEESELGRHRVVLLSYELRQRRCAGAGDIVGKTIDLIDTEQSDRDGTPHDTLDAQRYTVIGVLPPHFQFPIGAIPEGGSSIGRNADIWEPESLTLREKQARSVLDVMIGRLKPGISLKQAVLESETLFERIREETEHQPTQAGSGYRIDLLPLKRQVAGTAGRALLLLLGASAVVLLIWP